jgi:hypothetical protein
MEALEELMAEMVTEQLKILILQVLDKAQQLIIHGVEVFIIAEVAEEELMDMDLLVALVE